MRPFRPPSMPRMDIDTDPGCCEAKADRLHKGVATRRAASRSVSEVP